MKKFCLIFFISISNIFTTSEKVFVAETIAISGLISSIYELFGYKLDLSSLKVSTGKNFPYNEELGKWQIDTAVKCLSLPLSVNFFDEVIGSLLKIKDEVLKKKLINVFKKNLTFFSKCFSYFPSFRLFFKDKFKKYSKNKTLSISAFFNFLNAFLTFKVNKKIDEYSLKKDMKFINKSVLQSSFFFLKHFFINKAFDYMILLSLILASDNFEEANKDIEDLEILNKNMYNVSDLLLAGTDALKSF